VSWYDLHLTAERLSEEAKDPATKSSFKDLATWFDSADPDSLTAIRYVKRLTSDEQALASPDLTCVLHPVDFLRLRDGCKLNDNLVDAALETLCCDSSGTATMCTSFLWDMAISRLLPALRAKTDKVVCARVRQGYWTGVFFDFVSEEVQSPRRPNSEPPHRRRSKARSRPLRLH
jgi:hypothetical protein